MWVAFVIGAIVIWGFASRNSHPMVMSSDTPTGNTAWNGVTLDQVAKNMVTMSGIGTPQTISDAIAGLRGMPVVYRQYCVVRAQALGANSEWLGMVRLGLS